MINTASSPVIIRQILQLAYNSVYLTIVFLIHNLITYTTLRNKHLKLDKKIITVAKSPPKRLDDQSNKRTNIHGHVKVNRPKNL